MTKEDLYRNVMDRYGIGNQTLMLAEETSEMVKACSKIYRSMMSMQASAFAEHFHEMKASLTEEIADTLVMIEQMMLYWDISVADVDEVKTSKLMRLLERMEESDADHV